MQEGGAHIGWTTLGGDRPPAPLFLHPCNEVNQKIDCARDSGITFS